MNRAADIIQEACAALGQGNLDISRALIQDRYPFQNLSNSGRSYSPAECTRVFIRDGFIDRYSGDRLLFPGVLRLLARVLPDVVPFHTNWKMSETHPAFWELFPTIDHVVPVARGGVDKENNWVSTSMLRNSAKSNWTLEELGWKLVPPGSTSEWDGLLPWFIRFMEDNQQHQRDTYLGRWFRAGKAEWFKTD